MLKKKKKEIEGKYFTTSDYNIFTHASSYFFSNVRVTKRQTDQLCYSLEMKRFV